LQIGTSSSTVTVLVTVAYPNVYKAGRLPPNDPHHTMSILAGKPHRILNKLAGLALFLSRDSHKDIIGEYVEPGSREAWIIDHLPEGGAHIRSEANGQFVGFDGPPKDGVHLIVSNTPKVWNILPDHSPDYKIKLHNTDFVISFTAHNIHPGMPAILEKNKAHDDKNQVWVITPPLP